MSLTEEECFFLDSCIMLSRVDPQGNKWGSRGIYSLDEQGFVNVQGGVYLSNINLTEIPIKFGRVDGDFYCDHNQLTSLENGPYEVTGTYSCTENHITSLPKVKIGRKFYFGDNPLTEFFYTLPLKKLHKYYNEFYICKHFPKTILRYKDILTPQEILKLLEMYPKTKLYI